MTVRQRQNVDANVTPIQPLSVEMREGGESLREDGDAFLAAADEAIARALSTNSEEFLAQNRQMGGQ
jgi:hypothetical protein